MRGALLHSASPARAPLPQPLSSRVSEPDCQLEPITRRVGPLARVTQAPVDSVHGPLGAWEYPAALGAVPLPLLQPPQRFAL